MSWYDDRRFMSWNREEAQAQEEEIVMESKPVRLAIVGINPNAEKFYQANRFGRNLEMLAVCGSHMEEVESFVARKGRMACSDDIKEIADCDWLDAAFVCTDRRSRFSDCLTLLKAGKHVLCVPPMAETSQQVKELYDTAEENKVILMEGIPAIHAPAFEKMIPYMDSLGKIRHATFHNCHYNVAYQQKNFGLVSPEFNPELTGGALMEMGVYPVAFMVAIFGVPKAVHAAGVTLSDDMNITGTILMEYPDMIGEAIYSKISDSAMPSQIQGEEGSMLIQEIDNIKDLRISRRKVDQAIHFEQSDNIYHHETNTFVQMIQAEKGLEKNRALSTAIMEVLEEASRQMGLREESQE